MNTRLSKVSATALLVLALSLNIAPSAYAAERGDDSFGRVGDRIVRFIQDIRDFFVPRVKDELAVPRG